MASCADVVIIGNLIDGQWTMDMHQRKVVCVKLYAYSCMRIAPLYDYPASVMLLL